MHLVWIIHSETKIYKLCIYLLNVYVVWYVSWTHSNDKTLISNTCTDFQLWLNMLLFSNKNLTIVYQTKDAKNTCTNKWKDTSFRSNLSLFDTIVPNMLHWFGIGPTSMTHKITIQVIECKQIVISPIRINNISDRFE